MEARATVRGGAHKGGRLRAPAHVIGAMTLGLSVLYPGLVGAQQDFSAVKIESQKMAGHVYMLTGAGGNLAISEGPDGVILVDDQFAPLGERIRAAIAKISAEPIRFVLNTHWHGDHTGGNAGMHALGAVIVAHENVRQRMSTEQFSAAFNRTTPPSPTEALPVVTFAGGGALHLNGETVRAHHVPAAHTDGDLLIHFEQSDVLHMGDTFFNGFYPYIDLSSGGSYDGVVAAAEKGLELAGKDTKLVPGHGPAAVRGDLVAYHEMLVEVRGRILKAIAAGEGLEAFVARQPTADLDAKWGGGFMKPKVFLSIAFESLSKTRGRR